MLTVKRSVKWNGYLDLTKLLTLLRFQRIYVIILRITHDSTLIYTPIFNVVLKYKNKLTSLLYVNKIGIF